MIHNFLYKLYNLRKDQWLKPFKIKEIQQKRLRSIIKHAYNNVPYYHKLFDSHNIKPNNIKTIEDLSKIPITTKSKLSNLGKQILATNIYQSNCLKERTSGSSGIPLTIFRRKEDKEFFDATLYREFLENGLRFRDKRAAITSERVFPKKEYWFRNLGIFRKTCLSVFDNPEHLINIILKNKPDVISGYPSALRVIATKIKEKKVENINPRLIFTHAELLDNNTRNTINKIFGVQLSDLYGCMEVGPISWECPRHENYHINSDSCIVEFVKNGESLCSGEKGEIVVTGLFSFAMPFIRYKIGDVGVPTDEECSCGRGLPMMKSIEGRIVDSILLPNGKIVSPYVLTCITENISGIKRYQIIQEKNDLITLKYIKNENYSKETNHKIKIELQKFLGKDIFINPICVNELQKDRSGKFRVVKSLVT